MAEIALWKDSCIIHLTIIKPKTIGLDEQLRI